MEFLSSLSDVVTIAVGVGAVVRWRKANRLMGAVLNWARLVGPRPSVAMVLISILVVLSLVQSSSGLAQRQSQYFAYQSSLL